MHIPANLLPALKAAILAETDPEFVVYRTNGQTPLMAFWLNLPATPAVKVWASNVDPQVSDMATPWTAYDNIASAGKRDAWVHAFMRYPRNYALGTVRKWVTDVWGAATGGSNAEQILTDAGQRDALRIEVILGGTTPATTGSVTAIKLTWEGNVDDADIGAALALI